MLRHRLYFKLSVLIHVKVLKLLQSLNTQTEAILGIENLLPVKKMLSLYLFQVQHVDCYRPTTEFITNTHGVKYKQYIYCY